MSGMLSRAKMLPNQVYSRWYWLPLSYLTTSYIYI